MKKIIYSFILVVLLIMIMPIQIQAKSTTQANEYIDVDKKVNLSIEYKYEDIKFNNVNVKIYYIASVSEDFQYQLSSDFNKYSIKTNGIKNASDWDKARQTLEAYISADKIKETMSMEIKNNSININNLKTGLYLVVTETINTDDYILEFDSFLISLPNLNENGYFDYEVNVKPKAINYTPKFEEVTYTVIKEWEDENINRPESVIIEIFKDEESVEKQILSSENNWMYSWKTVDDGSKWRVVERSVPEEYQVYILKDNYKFTIVNSIFLNPGTSDNITNSVLVFFISFLVLTAVVIYLLVRKNRA